jgi:hypothetical protein
MLLWLALLGVLICLGALALRNAGVPRDRVPARWSSRFDLAWIGLGLLALIFAVRPTLPNVIMLVPFLAAIAAWAWAFGLRSAGFAWMIVACSVAVGFGSPEPDVLAVLPVAAVIASVAAIERERWLIVGGLLGYATIAASWPAVFALAWVLRLALDRDRSRFRAAWPGLVSFVALGLITALLPEHGSSASFGLGEPDPAGPRAVGLRWLFALDGNLDMGKRWLDYPAKLEHLRERSDWLWTCAGMLMIPVLVAIRRLEPPRFVAIAGCTALLGFASVDASTWVVACVLVAGRATILIDRPLTLACAGLLAFDLALRALAHVHPAPFLYNIGATSLLTLSVIGLGVALLIQPELKDPVEA